MSVPRPDGPQPLSHLTEAEARANLRDYLIEGRANVVHLQREAHRSGIDATFDIASLEGIFDFVYRRTIFLPREPDEVQRAIPGLFKGTEKKLHLESAHGVLTLSYYLGETFVRSFPDMLRWDIAGRETVHANHPAILGFRHELEMAVAAVARNTLLQAAQGSDPPRELFRALVDHWRNDV